MTEFDRRAGWLEYDLWTECEFRDLCCGLDPSDNRAANPATNDAIEAIRRGVLAGALVSIDKPGATAGDRTYYSALFFRPKDVIPWASKRFPATFPFKDNLIRLVEHHSDDPRWPPELDIATMAWTAAKNSIKKGDGLRPREFIRNWLKENKPVLTDSAIDRICTVANWDKSPGAAKKSTG